MEQASSVALQSENATYALKAADVLKLIELLVDKGMQDVSPAEILTPEIFNKLVKSLGPWFHFRGNTADRELRLKEEALLQAWVKKAETLGLGSSYHPILKGDGERGFDDEKGIAKFCDKLSSLVQAGVEQEALNALSHEGGIRSVLRRGTAEGVKAILLNVGSKIWNPNGSSDAEKILATANKNEAVQKNARYFLDLLWDGTSGHAWELHSDIVKEFYKHPDLITSIWEAAIATPLQYRRLNETRQIRECMISMGVPPERLKVPDWLLAGKKDQEKFTMTTKTEVEALALKGNGAAA